MADHILPIYNSSGDAEAFLLFPFLFNHHGEWIGFTNSEKEVFSILGAYVGLLTTDFRIVRKRFEENKPHQLPPEEPAKIRIPATFALPGMMMELNYGLIDVLLEEPSLLHPRDSGEFRLELD